MLNCMFCCFSFDASHCPPSYAAVIAKATVDAIQASDLSSYEVEREEEEGKCKKSFS